MRAATKTTTRARVNGGSRRPPGRPKRYGSRVPRVFTPPLHELEPRSAETERWTLGYDVIDFALAVLGITLYPWQEWLLVHLLEVNEDGGLRFRTALVLVARQNGKSLVSKLLALWFMVVWKWPLVLGTAQDLDVAEEIWAEVVGWFENLDEDDQPLYPDLAALKKNVVRVNGKKALELRNNTRYKVKAANKKAGRGLSGNLVLLDELRTHTDFGAWGAITKTTMARREALVLCLSNAGDETAVVLRHLRKIAHAALGDPDGINRIELVPDEGITDYDLDDIAALLDESDLEDFDDVDPADLEQDPESLFLAEWSAPPNADPADRSAWAWANPSMNHGELTEGNIAASLRTDDARTFREECLCQWSDGVAQGPFPPGSWEEGQNVPEIDEATQEQRPAPADVIVGRRVACVDMSPDRAHAWVTVAGRRADGHPQVEVVAKSAGMDWVRQWLIDNHAAAKIDAVTGQAKGAPISPLITELEADATFPVAVVPLAGSDLLDAFAWTFDAVKSGTVRHHRQPPLDRAAALAKTNTLAGGASLLDRKHSEVDIAPLQAFMGALWLLLRRKPVSAPPPQLPRAVRAASSDSDGPLTADINDMAF